MTFRGTTTSLALAGLISLLLASTSLAGPAGDEYLPKLPQSGSGGSHASASSAGTGTTTLPTDTTGGGSATGSGNPSGNATGTATEPQGKAKKSNDRQTAV